MSVEDTTMADPVPAESSIDNDQEGPNDGVPEASAPKSSTGVDIQKETAQSSDQIGELEEAPAQVEGETTTTDISQIEQVQDQAIDQQEGKTFRKAF